MKNKSWNTLRKIFLIIILSAMLKPVFSQDSPEFDKFPTSAGTVEIHFIGHASLMFKINGYVIHVDPVKTQYPYEFLPKADMILVTHEHGDHFDPTLIAEMKKPETILLCSEACAKKLTWGMVMKPGDRQEFNNIVVEATYAYNIVNESSPGNPFHAKGSGVGYILTIGGKRFYIAGDTENIPEMKALKNIYVAFLPMNLPYTMTPAMVADAALAFKPKILYPYHFGDTDTKQIVDLLKDSGIDVRIRKLK
jgi:L-ascorbate metabolism protein UlaG (beta-lactamase superfamily)